VSLFSNVYGEIGEYDSDASYTLELFENDGLKSMSEIGFRFNSRPLSNIVNDLNLSFIE